MHAFERYCTISIRFCKVIGKSHSVYSEALEIHQSIYGEKRVHIPHQVYPDAIYHVDRIIPVKKLSL